MTIQTRGKRKVDAQTEIDNLAQAIADAGVEGGGSVWDMPITEIVSSEDVPINADGFYAVSNTYSLPKDILMKPGGSVKTVYLMHNLNFGEYKLRNADTDALILSMRSGRDKSADIVIYRVTYDESQATKFSVAVLSKYSSASEHVTTSLSNVSNYIDLPVMPAGAFFKFFKSSTATRDVVIRLGKSSSTTFKHNGMFFYDADNVLGTGTGKIGAVLENWGSNSSKKLKITKTGSLLHIAFTGTTANVTNMLTGYSEAISSTGTTVIGDGWGEAPISYENPKREYKGVSTTSFGTTTSTTEIFGGMFSVEAKGASTSGSASVATKVYYGALFNDYYQVQLNSNTQPYIVSTGNVFLDLGNVDVLDGTSLRGGIISVGSDGKPICDFHLYMHRDSNSRSMHWRLKIDWYVEPLVLPAT